MKRKNILYALACVLVLAIQLHCSKDTTPVPIQQPPLPPPPPPPPTSTVISWANIDMAIEAPLSSVLLMGIKWGGETSFTSRWEKISGPASVTIQHPDSLVTRVDNLVVGTYQFRLRLTDRFGYTSNDTMTLYVEAQSSPLKQVRFLNIAWSCHWDCVILLEEFDFYTGATPYRVYIRRGGSSTWEEAVKYMPGLSNRYYYDVSVTPYMIIWEDPVTSIADKPDIKIVF